MSWIGQNDVVPWLQGTQHRERKYVVYHPPFPLGSEASSGEEVLPNLVLQHPAVRVQAQGEPELARVLPTLTFTPKV